MGRTRRLVDCVVTVHRVIDQLTSTLPLRTNARSTTLPKKCLVSALHMHRVAGCTPYGTRAKAIDSGMVGENAPFVFSSPPCDVTYF